MSTRYVRYLVGGGTLIQNAIYEVVADNGMILTVSGGNINNMDVYHSDTRFHTFEVGDFVDFSHYSTKYIIKDCHIDGTYSIVPEGAANLLISSFKALLCDLTPILDRPQFNFGYSNSGSVTTGGIGNPNISVDKDTNDVIIATKECKHQGVNLSFMTKMWCCKFCGIDMKSETEV